MVASLARDLIRHQSSKPRQSAEPASDPKSQLVSLTRRVEALESSRDEHAKVMKMLADEVQSLARRAMIGYWIGVGGLVVALASIVVSLIR
ncbi:MAG: hypothetical protein V4864_14035 [Pseudomonadota bacterium]